MTDSRPAADNGNLPQPAAPFGTMPQHAEDTRNVPHSSAAFRTLPQHAERSEHHTLTVREVVRMFEDANVTRSERTIVGWCQVNALGVGKLDAFYDHGERRYYITPASAARAIEEELSKRPPTNQAALAISETPPEKETPLRKPAADEGEVESLKEKILNLEFQNYGKDMMIRSFKEERVQFIEEIKTFSYKVGSLETKLLQLDAPDASREFRHDDAIDISIKDFENLS